MDLNESWLESILHKKHYEDSPTKVEDVEVIVNEQKGDNYMSTVSKIKATVRLGSGGFKTVALISKDQHISPHLRGWSIRSGLFVREITMYRDIFPKLEDLMIEFGDQEEPLWCQCYDVRLYDRLVLEDLTVKGYAMAKRQEQLNFESASLVLRNLGKFHAMTSVLLGRSQIPMDLFRKNFIIKMPDEQRRLMIERTFVKTAAALSEWGGEWKEIGEKLIKGIPDMATRISAYFSKGYSEGFQVLNHGDCWTNNFLFKWQDGSDTPIAMKFVDLQLPYVGKPVTDLLWFLSSSVPIDMRTKHYDHLIEIYGESLLTNLQKFGYSGELPKIQGIMADLRENDLILLWLTLLLVPIVMGDENDAWDPEDSLKKSEDAAKAGKNFEFKNLNLSARQKYTIGNVVREAISNEWFK